MRTASHAVFQTIGLLMGAYFLSQPSLVLAQNGPPEPNQMFRQLDVNQDGKITLEEQLGPGSREFAQRLYEMAKKPATDSISRDEFLRIAEQHRQGGRGQPGAGPKGGGPGGPGGGPGGGPNSGRGPGQGPGGFPPRPGNGPPGAERGDLPPRWPPFLEGVDENGDQRLSRAELRRLVERFDALDTDQDGNLDIAELSAIKTGSTDSDASLAPNNTPKPKTSKTGSAGKAKPETTRPGSSGRNSSSKSAASKSASTTPRNGGQPTLVGVWRGWVVDGRGENPESGHLEMELTITPNGMSARELGMNRRAPGGLGEGTFSINAQGNSGNLDATQTVGQHAGKEYPGIFELDGDTLKWCVASRNPTRPGQFETGRGNYFMILHRQQ